MQRYSVIGIGRLQENSQRNLKRKEIESGGLRRSLPAITKSILVCKRKNRLLVSNLFRTLCKFYISKIIENATNFYCKQTFRFYQNSQQEIITLLYTYRGFSQLDPERHQQVT